MLRPLSKFPLRHKRVLLRVDFNVPIQRGRVRDDFRIRQTLPTIRELLRKRNSIVVLAHHSNQRQTLAPVALHLAKLLKKPVSFLRNPFRKSQFAHHDRLQVVLLENLRFWPGEESSSLRFARRLSRLGDVFVNDAFGVAHRRAASVSVLPHLLPSRLGFLFERELKAFDRVLLRPKRPLVAIFGGAKIDTKISILRQFSRLADSILVGGAIANVLFGVRKRGVSRRTAFGRAVNAVSRARNIVLPVDAVVAAPGARRTPAIRPIGALEKGEVMYDIGPKSQRLFRDALSQARTVVWNGPVGVVEVKAFSRGTLALAKVLVRSRADVHLGGGDTIAFLDRSGLTHKFRHISTGGGAMLAYLAGEKLPALEALRRSQRN